MKVALSDDVAWGLVDAAPDAIVATDDAGRILIVNRQTEVLFGYDRAELLGRSVDELLPERLRQQHRAHRARYRDEPRTRPMGVGMHLLGRRKDGSEFPVEISLSPMTTTAGTVVVAAVRDITGRIEAEQRLRDTERELHTLEDHERIARDLHDVVIQQLFASGMTLQAVWSRVKDPDVAQRVASVVDDLDRTIREIRTVIFGLQTRPELVEDQSRTELLQVIRDERDALGVEPHVRLEGPIESMPAEVLHELLPTLREALSNVARHAHASSVRVIVDVGDEIVLRVEDDGTGVAPSPRTEGNGIRNMRERAFRLGGDLDLASRPTGGTVLEWRVPRVKD